MTKIQKIYKLIADKDYRFFFAARKGWYNKLDDEEFVRRMYRYYFKCELNLDNPQKLTEKMQWLKLYDRNSLYTMMADKYAVKNWIKDVLGEEYLIPTLGVWKNPADIDWKNLPNEFVLKCTHDSGSVVVCRDKNTFDKKSAEKKLRQALNKNHYWIGREWQYKDIEPMIIAEPYIDSLGKSDSIEYKFTCFNGKVEFGTICTGIAHAGLSARRNDMYSREFEFLPWHSFYKNSDHPIENKPKFWDKMVQLSEKIAMGIPTVRVDFYVHNDKILFGETTFYTWSGFLKIFPEEWDQKLGDKLNIEDLIRNK